MFATPKTPLEPSGRPTHRLLIVDDDVELCELVREYLKPDGYAVEAVHDGMQGLQSALSGEYALVVLDEMLPGLKGFDCLRRIRISSRIPVIMLTARGDFVDRILGLEMGADDYLPKPFNPRELLARIQAVLRRVMLHDSALPPPTPEPLRIGDISLDRGTRAARKLQQIIELTAVEFDLLELFLKAAGQIVSRDTIGKSVLGRELDAFDRTIDVHVSNLRRKLGPLVDGSQRIKAVRGAGYLYVATAAAGKGR
jgi:two-component system, OmpR family, response regulator CpxR